MPQGFQAWSPTGLQTVDITDRLTRIIGSIYVNSPGSMNVPEFAQGSPIVWALPQRSALNNGIQPGASAIRATVSGTTLSWSSAGGDGTTYVPTTIIYGVR